MFERWFEKVFSFVAKHKIAVFLLVGCVVALCAISVPQIRFDNDIAGMFPADKSLRRDLSLIRENVFAGKVVLSFEAKDDKVSLDDLLKYVDQVAARLPGPLISDVIKGPSFTATDLAGFMRAAPQLVDEARLRAWAKGETPDKVDGQLRADRSRLLSFQGMFVADVVRGDPLGIFAQELSYLQRLSEAFGRNVTLYNGHFASRDGRHMMLVLETPVAVTDGGRSQQLLTWIRGALKDRPEGIGVDIVAGHTHTIANETLIKGDIGRTMTVAAIAFLVLLIGFFKDIHAAVFFLIPAVAVLIALVASSVFFGKVSAFVAALSSVIIGIADDYGIHVYTAVRTAGRRDVVVSIARPIILAALFTSGIFAVFFLSTINGYHQLAFLTIASIWLCVGFVLLLFPQLITLKPLSLPGGEGGPSSRRKDMTKVMVWGLCLMVMGVGASRVTFSTDITTLDGAGADVISAEKRFESVWLDGHKQSIFVVEAPTLDQALVVNKKVFDDSLEFSADVASIAPFFLSETDRKANGEGWTRFWQSQEGADLLGLFEESAQRYGFSPDAFAPFVQGVMEGARGDVADVPFLKQLAERFIVRSPGRVRVLTFFPEEPRFLEHFQRMAKNYPGAFVFSRTEFSERFSDIVNGEAARLAGLAGVMLLLVAVFFLRRGRSILMALAAVGTCLLAVAALFGFWGQPITAPAIVALMVAVGLSIDYGVFMMYSLQHNLDTGTAKAIVVSALTTLIGALSLLAAKHPALFSIGVSLSTGLGAGWLCAQLIVPALYRLSTGKGQDAHA